MYILSKMYQRLKYYFSINWTKTIYFNFKKFPFKTAVKLPVYFYGKVRFQSIEGKVIIEGPIKRRMIGFGLQYESNTCSKGIAEILLRGTISFKGHVQFGKDYFINVSKNAYLEMGHMASLGNSGKIICLDRIVMGTFARVGFESQIMDSNFHQMIDTQTGEKFEMTTPITIGNYNYIGNRVSIMSKTVTPNYCTISSSSFCNQDYSSFGENILIGGVPAKLLRKNISRDWANEVPMLLKAMT